MSGERGCADSVVGACTYSRRIVGRDFDFYPAIVRVVTRNRKREVVGGEGGGDAVTFVACVAVEG